MASHFGGSDRALRKWVGSGWSDRGRRGGDLLVLFLLDVSAGVGDMVQRVSWYYIKSRHWWSSGVLSRC